MDYWIIIPVALAVAFVISALDYWVYIVFWRGMIALALAASLYLWLGVPNPYLFIGATASTFVALASIEIIERVTKVAVSVRPR